MRQLRCALGLVAVLLLGSATESLAVLITAPTGLNPGDQYRLIFLSSGTTPATSANIADYNTFVTVLADAVPELLALGATWTAVGSTATVDARDNTNTNPNIAVGVPIYLLNDTLVVNDYADLWDGSVSSQIPFKEDGSSDNFQTVWTGTQSNGTASGPLGSGSPTLGSSSIFNSWIAANFSSATNGMPLYAMSSVLTVVPEPGTAALLMLSLVGLAWRFRRHV